MPKLQHLHRPRPRKSGDSDGRSRLPAEPSIKAPADLWEQLDAAREPFKVVERPPGAFTVAEYAAQFGLTRPAAHDELSRLVKNGKLTRIANRGGGKAPSYYLLV